jgi:hypothetical protein
MRDPEKQNRAAARECLRPIEAAQEEVMARKGVRQRVAEQLRKQREEIRQQVARGELPALPNLSDEEAGEEAIRLVKESRRQRGTRPGASRRPGIRATERSARPEASPGSVGLLVYPGRIDQIAHRNADGMPTCRLGDTRASDENRPQ